MSDKKFIAKFFIFILVWLALFFLIIPTINSDQYQNSSIKVSVTLVEPIAMVEISPNDIYLGNITKGYSTDFKNISFNNTGNIDIKIVPMLNSSNYIFNYLEFNTGNTCLANSTAWHNISYYSNLNKTFLSINKPDVYGGIRQDSACLRLNLEDYNETIHPTINLTANLTIWVMPA